MKVNTDFTKILKKEDEMKWVALSEDRREVLGSDDSLALLQKKLGDKKGSAIYMKVLPSDREFAFESTEKK